MKHFLFILFFGLSVSSLAQLSTSHLSIKEPKADLKRAFEVQKSYVKETIKEISGFKGGAVSAGAKKYFGVKNPMAAVLPKSGWLSAEKPQELNYFKKRLMELELGFIFGENIKEVVKDIESLKTKVKATVPVVELPVKNIEVKGKLKFIDFIAANVGAYQYIVGKPFPKDMDVDSVKMHLLENGKSITAASGVVADGGQWKNLLFQVNHAISQGYEIKAGHLVITGSLGKVLPAKKAAYKAVYEDQQTIEFSFK
ncbi:MAG: hypothetical protein NE330_21995 [Lentisphaeraceae bacterium]|nr:hypothetical protein [Lentisphaeraceae bacterium]